MIHSGKSSQDITEEKIVIDCKNYCSSIWYYIKSTKLFWTENITQNKNLKNPDFT